MISTLPPVSLPPDASPEARDLALQLNQRLVEIELHLASLKGSDGQLATITSDLDLSGKRIKNSGASRSLNDSISNSDLRYRSPFRQTGTLAARARNLSAMTLTVPAAAISAQAVNLQQLNQTSAASIAALLASGITWKKTIVTATTYTVGATDDCVYGNCASAQTFTLYAATGTGKVHFIKQVGAGTVTISRTGSDTIDGETSQTLTQYSTIMIQDAAAGLWYII